MHFFSVSISYFIIVLLLSKSCDDNGATAANYRMFKYVRNIEMATCALSHENCH